MAAARPVRRRAGGVLPSDHQPKDRRQPEHPHNERRTPVSMSTGGRMAGSPAARNPRVHRGDRRSGRPVGAWWPSGFPSSTGSLGCVSVSRLDGAQRCPPSPGGSHRSGTARWPCAPAAPEAPSACETSSRAATSTTIVRNPRRLAARPRAAATVDLPTPPLPVTTSSECANRRSMKTEPSLLQLAETRSFAVRLGAKGRGELATSWSEIATAWACVVQVSWKIWR